MRNAAADISARTRRRLQDQVVVVTGSSRGIGREVARVLLEVGSTVVLNGRNPERLAETHRRLLDDVPSGSVSSVACDISSEEGAAELARHTVDTWGRIDVLINNAGVSMRGSIAELRSPALDHLVRGNLHASVLPTVATLPHLVRSGGRVVFVSTVAAMVGFPGVSLYSATKRAVETFAESLRAETAQAGLSVGVVFLGFVENDPDKETVGADGTPFHHERRAMQTQRQAATAIVRASANRRRRTVTVGVGRVLDGAQRLFPGLTSRILGRSGGRFHAVT